MLLQVPHANTDVQEENALKPNINVQLRLHAQLDQLSVLIYHALYHYHNVLRMSVKMENITVTMENVLTISKNVQLDLFVQIKTQSYVPTTNVFKILINVKNSPVVQRTYHIDVELEYAELHHWIVQPQLLVHQKDH